MIAFFRCVAEAVVEQGVRGLAEMVPGGGYAFDVAGAAWKKYRERMRGEQIRAEVQQLARTSFDDARREAVAAAREAVGGGDTSVDLELFLAQIPAAIQRSLKRTEDPTGTTVPAAFTLTSPEDVLRLLPPRPPRFRPGEPLPGLPGWVLDRLLGIGGFGEVWLARHPHLTALTGAVKFCHGQQASDLRHEGGLIDQVMAAGEHPSIVRLRDARLDGDPPWLMYEYVAGGDLTDWIRQLQRKPGAERVKQAVFALRQLADAVGHFHRLAPPLVHRDLKPANILLDKASRRLRVTDFGIGAVAARAVLVADTAGELSRGGRLASSMRGSHTPLYASPQQRAGADPDPRDDVHALGVIGYQLITGHLDQGAGPDFADDLREQAAPEDLIALLGRCVAQRPDRRPVDATALSADLARIGIQTTSTPARPLPETVVPPPPAPIPLPASPAPAPVAAEFDTPPQSGELPPLTTPAVEIHASILPNQPSEDVPTGLEDNSRKPRSRPQRPKTPAIGAGKCRVTLPGRWLARPVDAPDEQWRYKTSTPATVTVRPGEVYMLEIETSIKDSDLSDLSELAALDAFQGLSLATDWDFTDVCARQLSVLTGLRYLALERTSITDAGIEALAPLTRLKELLLTDNQIGDRSLAACVHFPSLRQLGLAQTKVTDAGLMHLKSLAELHELDLSRCKGITDAGVASIAELRNLQSLDLSETQVSMSGVETLRSRLPNCTVDYEN